MYQYYCYEGLKDYMECMGDKSGRWKNNAVEGNSNLYL